MKGVREGGRETSGMERTLGIHLPVRITVDYAITLLGADGDAAGDVIVHQRSKHASQPGCLGVGQGG